MSTVEETRRELFEAAYLKKYFHPAERWSLIPEKYRTQHAEITWWAFNAALDAVVIELPPSVDMPDEEECGDYEEYEAMEAITCTANGVRHACRAAIESTNLGITVK